MNLEIKLEKERAVIFYPSNQLFIMLSPWGVSTLSGWNWSP